MFCSEATVLMLIQMSEKCTESDKPFKGHEFHTNIEDIFILVSVQHHKAFWGLLVIKCDRIVRWNKDQTEKLTDILRT